MISHDRSHDYEFGQVDDPLGYAWWVVCHMTTVYWYSSLVRGEELLSIGFNQPVSGIHTHSCFCRTYDNDMTANYTYT